MQAELGRGESPQVRASRVVAIVAGIMAVLMLVAFGFQLLFRDRIGQTYAVKHGFPEPAVIANELGERVALEAAQKRKLRAMHIDSAMKSVAAKGPHAFDPVGGAP
ncbi:MAG: hypothetical protein JOZ72_12780 [Alphaproteobacteria bacterium]|nr:hypothetical protein [Alphaproteobacteria bacterium]